MALRRKKLIVNRLAKNFHRTFIPEKSYLGAMLKYAANEGLCDMLAIADATGIPTGVSSGKVLPTVDYCMAMHLVSCRLTQDKKYLSLTPLGRAILLEDKFFRESLSQWIAHLFLCNKNDGAEVWYQIFWNSSDTLGSDFDSATLFRWISPILGLSDGKALSPAIRMYSDENSFSRCGAIVGLETSYHRSKGPLDSSFAIGYSAWLTDAIERHGHSGMHVTVDDLESYCGFRSLSGWSLAESQLVLSMLERKGTFVIDRQMRPWSVCNKYTSTELWRRLYEDFI